MKKVFLALGFFVLSGTFAAVWAVDYLFSAEGCEECQDIVDFVEEHDLYSQFGLEIKDIRHDKKNIKLFGNYLEELQLFPEEIYLPFLVIDGEHVCEYMEGKRAIANYYASQLDIDEVCFGGECEPLECESEVDCNEHFSCQASVLMENAEGKMENVKGKSKLKFLGILLPAALADSVNPCAFAVILLLLFSIISLEKNYKRALWAGLLFTLSIFLSYFLMGLGIFSALSQLQMGGFMVVRYIIAGMALLIALLNFKDFFWYGKGFLMEVPLSWRPKMQKIIKGAVSPLGAFGIGFVVSLFLLPCTSGPYFVVLGYLASESANLQTWGYVCLALYNLVFVLPMLLIVFAIAFGWKSAEDLGKLKNKYKRHIHLIVGILMLVMAGLVVWGM